MTRPTDDTAILLDAARWLDRARHGTADDRRAFRAWLSERPEHVAAMDLVERAWRQAPEAARQAGLQARPRRGRRMTMPRWSLPILAPALGTVLAGICGLLLWNGSVRDQRIAAPAHGVAVATLADGTRVWLTAGSAVRMHITPIDRAVSLTGEAVFDVRHDWRPFAVTAGEVRVVDHGTLFSVANRGARTEIVLARGAVEVQDRRSTRALATPTPGQQVAVTGGTATVTAIDADAALSWRAGRVVADDLPLSAVAARFGELGGPRITIADARLRTLRVYGTYSAKDAAAFLTALESLYPIVWQRVGDGYEVRRR